MRRFARVWSGLPAILLLVGLQVGAASGAETTVTPKKAWLGVVMQDLDTDLRESINYRGDGVLITDVRPASPADKAGLKSGDVLVSVNGRVVKSSDELSTMIGGMRVDQSASLVVMRDGTRRTLNTRLVARPDEESWSGDRTRRMRAWRDHGDSGKWEELGPDFHFDMRDLPEKIDNSLFVMGMGRGRLGVRVENLTEDLAPYFNSTKGSGALVVEVMKDTPADKAGLKAGDVITKVGDEKITDSDDLSKAMRSAPEGKIKVTATRRGTSHTYEAELPAAPRAWMRDGDMSIGPRRFMYRTPMTDAQRDELKKQLKELEERIDKLEKH